MIAAIPAIQMAQAMQKASISTLQRTIKNSNARIAKGLTGNAKQTELNRIYAARQELDKRAHPNKKTFGQVTTNPVNLTAQQMQPVIVHSSFTGLALVAGLAWWALK